MEAVLSSEKSEHMYQGAHKPKKRSPTNLHPFRKPGWSIYIKFYFSPWFLLAKKFNNEANVQGYALTNKKI
jgi:hypothetical protein